MKQPKHSLKVYTVERPFKASEELREKLKDALSGKMITRMKKEAVRCPLLKEERPFLECFVCDNFLRRVKGEVHCAGAPKG